MAGLPRLQALIPAGTARLPPDELNRVVKRAVPALEQALSLLQQTLADTKRLAADEKARAKFLRKLEDEEVERTVEGSGEKKSRGGRNYLTVKTRARVDLSEVRTDLANRIKQAERLGRLGTYCSKLTDEMVRLREHVAGNPDERVQLDVGGMGEAELVGHLLTVAHDAGLLPALIASAMQQGLVAIPTTATVTEVHA